MIPRARIRIRNHAIYAERAPDAWVRVCSLQEWEQVVFDDKRQTMVRKAVRSNTPDGLLPPEDDGA